MVLVWMRRGCESPTPVAAAGWGKVASPEGCTADAANVPAQHHQGGDLDALYDLSHRGQHAIHRGNRARIRDAAPLASAATRRGGSYPAINGPQGRVDHRMTPQGGIIALILCGILAVGGFGWISSLSHQQAPTHADRLDDIAASAAALAAAAIDSGGTLSATSSTFTDTRLGTVTVTVSQSGTVVTAMATASGITRTSTAKL